MHYILDLNYCVGNIKKPYINRNIPEVILKIFCPSNFFSKSSLITKQDNLEWFFIFLKTECKSSQAFDTIENLQSNKPQGTD